MGKLWNNICWKQPRRYYWREPFEFNIMPGFPQDHPVVADSETQEAIERYRRTVKHRG